MGTWSKVQSNWPANSGITGSSLTMSSSMTVGNLIILATFVNTTTAPVPSSSAVATWHRVGSTSYNRGDGYYINLFWGVVTTGSVTSISYTCSGASYFAIGAVEFNPGGGTISFDSSSATGVSSGSGSGLSITVTAAAAAELILAYSTDTNSPATPTPDSGNTVIPSSTGNNFLAYILSGASGSNTCGLTFPSGISHAIVAGAFVSTSAPPPSSSNVQVIIMT